MNRSARSTPRSGRNLREWLVTLHHDLNVTTVFVTHDQEEAMEVSNRIVIFSRGSLEQVGPPARFMINPPMSSSPASSAS